MDAITLSMSLPMARTPAPCISLLLEGGFPQASGKVFFTAVQQANRVAQIPSKSVSPVAMFRYGNKQPDGLDRLSCNILIIEVSATTAACLLSWGVDAREMSLWKGE